MPLNPEILVTMPDHDNRLSWFCLRLVLRLMRGRVTKITPSSLPENINDLNFNGLVLSGGTDINPDLYDGDLKPNYTYDPDRDAMELALIKIAQQRNIPILGICRGAQMINVQKKGSLHFDVAQAYKAAHYPNNTLARIFYRKRMFIGDQSSHIHHSYGQDSIRVNSIHSQSINRLGQGLKITGQEKNGVIQCVEDMTHPFVVGVQYHPEYLAYSTLHRKLFKRFLNHCRSQMQNS